LEDIKPHRTGIIIRDEISKLAVEKGQRHFAGLLEFLCELWDGHIESYRTRTFGFEGGFDVYISMISTGNDLFLKKITEDFWIIGLGARVLFVDDIEERKEKFGKYFFYSSVKKKELEQAYSEIIRMMKELKGKNLKSILWEHAAEIRWKDYEWECKQARDKLKENDSGNTLVQRTLIAKKAQQVLRLAMNYAASRFSINEYGLFIRIEDIERAITDVEEYYNCAVRIVDGWERRKAQKLEERAKSSKYDLREFVTWAIVHGKDYCSPTEIGGATDCSNVSLIKKTLYIGVNKNPPWLEEVVPYLFLDNYFKEGKVSKEIYNRFKPKSGNSPAIFKVTPEGKKAVGYIGGKVDENS
jgi:hypothetical protein